MKICAIVRVAGVASAGVGVAAGGVGVVTTGLGEARPQEIHVMDILILLKYRRVPTFIYHVTQNPENEHQKRPKKLLLIHIAQILTKQNKPLPPSN